MDLGSSNIPVTEIYQQRLNGALLVFNEFRNPDLIVFFSLELKIAILCLYLKEVNFNS